MSRKRVTMWQLAPIVESEMNYARGRFGPYHNAHEFSAVLREEVEEHWEHVKDNTADTTESMYELTQVASVALRYVAENGNTEAIAQIQNNRHKKPK